MIHKRESVGDPIDRGLASMHKSVDTMRGSQGNAERDQAKSKLIELKREQSREQAETVDDLKIAKARTQEIATDIRPAQELESNDLEELLEHITQQIESAEQKRKNLAIEIKNGGIKSKEIAKYASGRKSLFWRKVGGAFTTDPNTAKLTELRELQQKIEVLII